jgi:hypothetical protein
MAAREMIPDAEFKQWLDSMEKVIAEELRPKMERSFVALVPVNKDVLTDPLILIQVGMAVLLDKPLIIMVMDDTPIPTRVYDIAEEVVIISPGMNQQAQKQALRYAMERVMRKRGKK